MTYYRLLRVIDDREQCVYGNLLIACHYQTALEYIVICQLGIPVSRYMYIVEYHYNVSVIQAHSRNIDVSLNNAMSQLR